MTESLAKLNTDFLAAAKELQELLEQQRKKLQVQAEVVLKEITKAFFDKYPQAECLVWTQYTPYFNDGEECIFRVGDVLSVLKVDVVDEDIDEIINDEGSHVPNTEDFFLTEFMVKSEELFVKDRTQWLVEVNKYRASLDLHPLSLNSYYVSMMESGHYKEVYENNLKYLKAFGNDLNSLKKYSEDVGCVSTLIYSIPEEILKNLFGDHVMIKIFKDRVEVDEYMHD